MAWMVYDYPEPHGRGDREPLCPVCGAACSEIYRDEFFEIVGCDGCVTAHDAWETGECFA